MHKCIVFAVLIMLPIQVSCFHDGQSEEQQCAYTGWSTPETLSDSLDYFITPSLVTQADSIYVASGLATPRKPGPGVGFVLREPAGRQTFFSDSPFWPFPVAARGDRQGSIHVVWAEPIDTATVFIDGFPPDATYLYYRRYSNGRWSPRTLIAHHPGGLDWSTYPPPQLFIDRQDRLHFIYETPPYQGKEDAIYYVRKDEQGWTVRDTKLTGLYPTLAIESSGRLLLALVESKLPDNPKPGDQDHNSVFLSFSTDQGISWSEPALVSRSGLLGAHMPQFVEGLADPIHLLWAKEADRGRQGRVIWHATSTDATSWSTPQEIGTTLGGLPHTFRVVGTSDTCLHLIFERETSLLEGDRKLYYARWDGAQWTEPEDIFPETYSSTFDLALSEDGSLHLVWMRVPNLRWSEATLENLPQPEDWPFLTYSTNRRSNPLQ